MNDRPTTFFGTCINFQTFLSVTEIGEKQESEYPAAATLLTSMVAPPTYQTSLPPMPLTDQTQSLYADYPFYGYQDYCAPSKRPSPYNRTPSMDYSYHQKLKGVYPANAAYYPQYDAR